MSAPPSKRRRVELTLEDRINLIKDSESQPKPTLVVSHQNCIKFREIFFKEFAYEKHYLKEN